MHVFACIFFAIYEGVYLSLVRMLFLRMEKKKTLKLRKTERRLLRRPLVGCLALLVGGQRLLCFRACESRGRGVCGSGVPSVFLLGRHEEDVAAIAAVGHRMVSCRMAEECDECRLYLRWEPMKPPCLCRTDSCTPGLFAGSVWEPAS